MMGKFQDLSGNKYGRLLVISRAENSSDNRPQWFCKCDCGNTVVVRGYQLKRGRSKSCGCYHIEQAQKQGRAKATHHLSRTRLYNIWHDMIKRCYNKGHKGYQNYGGRGITICQEWLEDIATFYNWAMSNGYADDLTIDRIDYNGNYEPANCRWVSIKEQCNNTRKNHYITFNGETKTVSQWADALNIKAKTLLSRLNDYKWPIERALTEEVKVRKKK